MICSMLIVQSCYKDDKDLFPLPASERLEARMNQTQDSLTASPYGWTMDYYPDQSKTAGGYTYVMEFKENSHVFVGYELAKPNERKESIYEMIADEGPVLTFNTFNEYMHHFSTPDKDNYQGLGGDYEFVIMDIQPGYIKTKGKKSKNFMMMYRLDIPSEEYLTKVAEINQYLNVTPLAIKNKNLSFKLTKEEGKVFSYKPSDTANKLTVPYVYTDKGIRLFKPIEINGINAQNFVLTNDYKSINCTDEGASEVHLINSVEPPVFYNNMLTASSISSNSKGYWQIKENDNMSPKIRSIYDRIKASTIANGLTFEYADFGYFGQRKSHSLRLYVSRSSLYFDMDKATAISNSIAFNYNGKTNGSQFLKTIDGVEDLLNILSTTYSISAYGIGFGTMKMASTIDSDIYFDVTLK